MFVTEGDRLETKVMQLVRRSLSHAINEIHVDWNGLNIKEQIPKKVAPTVYDGETIVRKPTK